MNWKEDIGQYFSDKGVYRFDFLYGKLNEMVNEWSNYLNEFFNVRSLVEREKPNDDEFAAGALYGDKWVCVTVKNQMDTYFRAYLCYTINNSPSQLALMLISNTNYNNKDIFEFAKDDKDSNYFWQRELLTEPEIFEKGYILQILNSRLKVFNNNTKFLG